MATLGATVERSVTIVGIALPNAVAAPVIVVIEMSRFLTASKAFLQRLPLVELVPRTPPIDDIIVVPVVVLGVGSL